MNDHEFVTAVRQEVLDANLQTYKQLFIETKLDSATDPYWQEALRFYAGLDNAGKALLLKIMRQVMVDTVSNLFGILDGTTKLQQQPNDFTLRLSWRKLNGNLQDLFLEMEEENLTR